MSAWRSLTGCRRRRLEKTNKGVAPPSAVGKSVRRQEGTAND